MEKKPIDEFGEGNCCPKCGSTRITRHEQRNLSVDVNLSSNKPFNMVNEKIKPLTVRDKIIRFDNADTAGGCWSFECRKCGWVGETFTE